MKNCAFCGKDFKPANNKQKYCNRPHERICPVCGNTYIEKYKHQLIHPPHACSPKCRGILQSRTKAQKPKKLKKLQQILIENPEYLNQLEEANIVNRSNLIPKIEKWLQSNSIKYSLMFHINQYNYEFLLTNQNLLIMLAEYSQDCNHNLNKLKLAESQGFRCIIIYPWDSLSKILPYLLPQKIINLDECSLYKLNRIPANNFLNRYHPQNSCRNQLLYWGIIQDDEIVQLMTFGKPRYSKNYSIELMRYCTKPRIEVPGGYMNLFYGVESLQYIMNTIGYKKLGQVDNINYESLGFQYVKTTPPQEIWVNGCKYITASLLRLRGCNQLLGLNDGLSTDNEKLMLENGWLPIYDCGQHAYALTR